MTAQALEREFDATAPQYDRMVGLNPGYHDHLAAAARLLVGRLPAERPLRLADLGCGSGASTAALVDALGPTRAAQVSLVGVDASDGMLAVARTKGWPGGVTFRHGFAEDVANRAAEWGLTEPVDGVLAAYLFRNVGDRDATLQAVREVLAPRGVLVVQEYAVAGSRRATVLWTLVCWAVVIPLSLALCRRTTLYRYLWRSVLRFDAADRFARRLQDNGFELLDRETVGGWQRGILHTFVARRS